MSKPNAADASCLCFSDGQAAASSRSNSCYEPVALSDEMENSDLYCTSDQRWSVEAQVAKAQLCWGRITLAHLHNLQGTLPKHAFFELLSQLGDEW
jgi:hypothetical protein